MARFVPELDDIQELLEKKKICYAVVRGGVKDRDNEIHRFQYDDRCRVFVGQIAAAGLGITLTAASTMVFYSLDYSMSNFEQAKARIHRAGQKENCHYISKCLDNPELSAEEREAILEKEMEILKTVSEKDTEIRSQETETVRMVDKKDSEKRQFNWGIVKVASSVLVAGLVIGVGVLGGNVNIKLPKKL